jgi:hypothetical protein
MGMKYIQLPNLTHAIDGYVCCTQAIKFFNPNAKSKWSNRMFCFVNPGHVLPYYQDGKIFKVKTVEGVIHMTPFDFHQHFSHCSAPVINNYKRTMVKIKGWQ